METIERRIGRYQLLNQARGSLRLVVELLGQAVARANRAGNQHLEGVIQVGGSVTPCAGVKFILRVNAHVSRRRR